MTIHKPEELIKWLVAHPRETEWFEFKKQNNNHEAIGKYVSALANSAIYNGEPHGYLVFGVEDETHDLVGTDINLAAQKVGNESLIHWISKSLQPSLNFEHASVEIEGKRIELIRIDPAYKHPVRFRGEAYIRIDDSLHPLDRHPQREAAIWQAVNRFTFEEIAAVRGCPIEEIEAAFSLDYLFSKLITSRSEKGRVEYLTREGLLTGNPEGGYDVSNLLVLMSARRFRDWSGFEKKGVRVIQYKGKNKLEATYEQLGQHGYFSAFERVLDAIMERTPHREEMRHGLREIIYEIPRIAVREILANAIIHQDLTDLGFGPTVEIFSDRIVVTNAGIPLVEPDRFIDAPSKTRNNRLSDLMRRLGVCEERGSGIDRAFFEIESLGLPPPLIQKVSDRTVVTIFGPRKFANMTKEERLRACYFHACLGVERNELMRNSSLRIRFKLGRNQYPQVSEVINEAISLNLIRPLSESQGNRNARYVPYWY